MTIYIAAVFLCICDDWPTSCDAWNEFSCMARGSIVSFSWQFTVRGIVASKSNDYRYVWSLFFVVVVGASDWWKLWLELVNDATNATYHIMYYVAQRVCDSNHTTFTLSRSYGAFCSATVLPPICSNLTRSFLTSPHNYCHSTHFVWYEHKIECGLLFPRNLWLQCQPNHLLD